MIKQNRSKLILALNDFFWLQFAFLCGLGILYYFFNATFRELPSEEIFHHILLHSLLSGLAIIWFWIHLRHYTYRKDFWTELKEVLTTILLFAVINLCFITFSKLYFSHLLWCSTWLVVLILVPFSRILMKKFLIKTKLYLKDTIIIGGGANAIDAYNAINNEKYLGLNIKYFITKQENVALKQLNIPILNEMQPNLWQLITKPTDQFILALEDDEIAEQDNWLRYLSKHNYRFVSVIPSLRGLPLYSTNMSFLFSYDIMLLRINNNLAKRSSRLIKRTMDVIGALFGLALFSPFLLFISLFLLLNGGKVIYSHSRIGQNGKAFNCWKFRTMVKNSDQVLDNLLKNNPTAKQEWEKEFKLKNDPRITKLGKFLREYSFDELPQLFNVLIGQMSLVGPRPIVANELERYQDDLEYYLMAKPGMTGLWQVSGRNDVDYKTRVYFDAWYVKNWSLWNDIVILLKTIRVVLKGNGAY